MKAPAVEKSLRLRVAKDYGTMSRWAADFIEANEPFLRPIFTPEAWAQVRTHAQAYAFQECQALVEQAIHNCASA